MGYRSQINKINKVITELNWERALAREKRRDTNKKLKKVNKQIESLEKCRVLILTFAEKTQEKIVKQIEQIITLALQSVFGEGIKAFIKLEQKRDQQEATFYIQKEEMLLEIRQDVTAVGEIDVYAFGAKMAFWSLDKKAPPIILLDEPFKNLSRDYLPAAGELLKKISEEFKVQFIVISHEDSIIDFADNTISLK